MHRVQAIHQLNLALRIRPILHPETPQPLQRPPRLAMHHAVHADIVHREQLGGLNRPGLGPGHGDVMVDHHVGADARLAKLDDLAGVVKGEFVAPAREDEGLARPGAGDFPGVRLGEVGFGLDGEARGACC